MTRVPVRLLPSLVLLHLWVGAAFAETLQETEALVWLQKIANAARQLNYAGTFVYQHGDHVESSRITHFVDRAGECEKLETLDGPKREIIRTDDEILTLDGEHHVVKRERRTRRNSFPALLPDQLSHLTEHYQLRKGDQERIAGYDAQALVLEPRDGFRYGHKLWADVNTGLLLKARMLDERGHVVEQSVFTQLSIGSGVTRPSFGPLPPEWRREQQGPDSAAPADTGWIVKDQPAGFRKIIEMRRLKAGTQTPVAHLVYSDGLAAVSVFIEPLPTTRKVQEGLTRQGAVNIYTRPLPDQLVTVLGEAPAVTVMQMANSVTPRGQ
ncbi:MAG TPA: MucB/RseB C-terminal domain-containing protein [Burkholderiales bacterium]|nr:MucB/RseB C-terminal domain-containing protein [Burkholderiales bacterium]